jgi:hypothetical protein
MYSLPSWRDVERIAVIRAGRAGACSPPARSSPARGPPCSPMESAGPPLSPRAARVRTSAGGGAAGQLARQHLVFRLQEVDGDAHVVAVVICATRPCRRWPARTPPPPACRTRWSTPGTLAPVSRRETVSSTGAGRHHRRGARVARYAATSCVLHEGRELLRPSSLRGPSPRRRPRLPPAPATASGMAAPRGQVQRRAAVLVRHIRVGLAGSRR